jgi:Putative amidase domain
LSSGEVQEGIFPKYIKQHEFTFAAVGGKDKIKLKDHKLIDDPEDPSAEAIKNAVMAPPGAVPAIVDYGTKSLVPSQTSSSLNYFIPLSLVSYNSISQSDATNGGLDINKSAFGFSLLNRGETLAQLKTVYYNRVGARDYAYKWWNSFNPNYRKFTEQDCTNYASQILSDGGGWPFILNSQASNPDVTWWYASTDQTRSWTFAPAMYTFLSKATNRAAPVDRTSKLDVGDIVQIDFGKGQGLSHTMVVSKKRSTDGMIYLTGHSNPSFELPVYDILAATPNAQLFTWKLANSFNY